MVLEEPLGLVAPPRVRRNRREAALERRQRPCAVALQHLEARLAVPARRIVDRRDPGIGEKRVIARLGGSEVAGVDVSDRQIARSRQARRLGRARRGNLRRKGLRQLHVVRGPRGVDRRRREVAELVRAVRGARIRLIRRKARNGLGLHVAAVGVAVVALRGARRLADVGLHVGLGQKPHHAHQTQYSVFHVMSSVVSPPVTCHPVPFPAPSS